jgi:23S rRNA (guanosine2251-2'-O)-methyltransferase
VIKEIDKFADSNIIEGLTSIRAVLQAQSDASSLNDRKILKIIYDKARYSKIYKTVNYLRAKSYELGFEVIESSDEEISSLCIGNSHGGIIAVCSPRTIPELDDKRPISNNGFYVMIQGIEDPYNFGYALRSLYSCGASGIILPQRNWMTAAGVVCRASAGASELFDIYTSDALDAVNFFKQKGYKIVCADLETDNELNSTELKFPIFLVVGGEKRGISKALLELSDTIVKIPYARSFDASLSAASATTILGYEIMKQNL